MSTTFHVTGKQNWPNWETHLQNLEAERCEIEKVKWIESEKAQKDIGYERAEWIWLTRHRHLWLTGLKQR